MLILLPSGLTPEIYTCISVPCYCSSRSEDLLRLLTINSGGSPGIEPGILPCVSRKQRQTRTSALPPIPVPRPSILAEGDSIELLTIAGYYGFQDRARSQPQHLPNSLVRALRIGLRTRGSKPRTLPLRHTLFISKPFLYFSTKFGG